MNSLLTAPIELFQIQDGDGWTKTGTERLFDHPYIQIERTHYRTPGRPDRDVPWIIAHRKAAVAVAPRLADGRFILIAQERLPVQRTLWEFPAGQIDLPFEAITEEAIVRTTLAELEEEAGAELDPQTGRLQPLGYFLPSQGFTTEHVYLLLAEPVCVARPPQPEDSEHISDVRLVTQEELRRMIAANEITNALSLALYARMAAGGLV